MRRCLDHTWGSLYGDGSKPWYLVNPKIAGKWMFIPLKMVLIGIDPYPYTKQLDFFPGDVRSARLGLGVYGTKSLDQEFSICQILGSWPLGKELMANHIGEFVMFQTSVLVDTKQWITCIEMWVYQQCLVARVLNRKKHLKIVLQFF